MKKGFTLIELLAVIVILAVIALIATPLILNTIDKAKKGAFKDSVYGMMDAAELTIASKELEMPITFAYPLVEGYPTIDMKGEKPQEGYIEVNKEGQMKIELTNGTWCAKKGFEDPDVTLTKGACIVETDPSLFTVSATGETITGYTGTATDILIPAKINGKTITTIGNDSFSKKGLTSVVIPSTVISIEDLAFRENKLVNITIPDSVTKIGQMAFQLNELTTITIPSNVTILSSGAFSSNKLKSIILPSTITSIEQSTFSDNQLTSIILPPTITNIGKSAFYQNQLTSVEISTKVTSIGDGAFGDNQLTSVTIPSSVANIGRMAFDMNQLISVKIVGKSNSSQFRTYGTNIWGWKTGYSDANITWNATE